MPSCTPLRAHRHIDNSVPKKITLYRPNHKGKSKTKVAPIHAVMPYKGRGSIAPLILELNTGLKLVVNLMLWPLFPKQTALVSSK